ncbi:MAG: response regulator transcription factor [Bacteroidales bacterium]|nr:response regulator transcription factor [Bacteroidales bacterium]
MKALIVEDEKLAQQTLRRALERNFPDIEVVAITESVKGTLAWLRTPGNTADLIFMDVELQDGSAFEIFKQETITAKVIMTTAFDKYAVKAFEAGSMDYLLKPYDDEALLRAVSRCRAASENFDINVILSAMQRFARERDSSQKTFRRRFIVRLGQKIIPIETADIAYFYVEGKSKYIVKNDGTQYFFDQQMESILDELDPQVFFRISRNFIISSYAIQGIERIYGGRLKILMTTPPETDMIVARSRVSDFMAWLA